MISVFVRYAELYPEEVDRIFMLCPSFGLGTRAGKFASEEEMAEWEQTGARGTYRYGVLTKLRRKALHVDT